MVSGPLHEQIVSPLLGEYPGSVEINDNTYLDINKGHFFTPNYAIPLKTELKNINKLHISFLFVKDSGELDREDPSSYVKHFLQAKNASGCYLIYCLSWY